MVLNNKTKNSAYFYRTVIIFEMKSLFDDKAFAEVKDRIENLTSESQPLWGKMNVAQMCAHCQEPINVVLEKKTLNAKPNWLLKTFFKKAMYNDKPYRHNLPTAKQYIVSNEREFKNEQKKLLSLVKEFSDQKGKESWLAHPIFGEFTEEQYGQMIYKHLDHHLQQFGV